jgi:hypothetical protein
MSDTPSLSLWKRIAIRSFFGGVGIVIALGIVAGSILWYRERPERPKPWNETALTAKFDTMEIAAGGWTSLQSYPVSFFYNVRNNTDRNYEVDDAALTKMAVLTDGMVLSKGFGNYQEGDAIVEGPPFIPPGGTARIIVRVSYYFPDDFTKTDEHDSKKLIATFNHRLKELSGFVIFDEQNHYQINLPEGWKQIEGVKEDKGATEKTQ